MGLMKNNATLPLLDGCAVLVLIWHGNMLAEAGLTRDFSDRLVLSAWTEAVILVPLDGATLIEEALAIAEPPARTVSAQLSKRW